MSPHDEIVLCPVGRARCECKDGMRQLQLSHAIRFARECGERHNLITAPVLFWRYTFDKGTI